MKILIVDNFGDLHKGEHTARAVVILNDWGHVVVTEHGDEQEFCTDLGKLLSLQEVSLKHLNAVKCWLRERTG